MVLLAGREWFCLSTRYTAIIEVFLFAEIYHFYIPDLYIFWS